MLHAFFPFSVYTKPSLRVPQQQQCPALSSFLQAASFQVLCSQGWLPSASTASQRLLYLFLKPFSFSVAQQLLTHPGSCGQLLLLSIPWQFFS